MHVIEQIKDWWLYLSSCFSSDYSSVVCRSYWNWVAYGAFALAGLIIILVGWSLLREYSAFWRGRLHLKARIVAGDALELDSAELAEKFRAALETRKAELRNSESAPAEK